MPPKKQDINKEFDALKDAIQKGELKRLYIFHGDERYLLENFLGQIRKKLAAGDFADFNHKKFSGQGLSVDELISACDALPVFSDRTLIEVHDYDLSKASEENREKLLGLFTDLPEYVCLIFVFDTVEYSIDARLKLGSFLKKEASVVEFSIQEQSKLVKWIKSHFAEGGKKIDTPASEYLAFVTGGLMTSMNTEIGKLCAYAVGEFVTKEDIDAVVTPVTDAVAWKLTDYIISGSIDQAAVVLIDLMNMREPPHKLIYSITSKLRHLMAARVCFENGLSEKHLMTMANIKFDFQARNLMAGARRTSLRRCRDAVLISTEIAFKMNSGGDPEDLLTDLLINLACCYRGQR